MSIDSIINLNKKTGVEAKQHNLKKQIIRSLYFSGAKSIPEISKEIQHTVPTVTSLINELLSNKIIEDTGQGDSKGGRKPSIYGLKPSAANILVIEIGLQFYRFGIYNLLNENVSGIKYYEEPIKNDDKYLDKLVKRIFNLIKLQNTNKNIIIGAGVYFPGLVNPSLGNNFSYLNFSNKPIQSVLEEKLNLPVFIENDSRAIAVGEYRYGKGKGKKNVLSINLDEGIGLGIIIDGKILHGKSGFAGELGHIPIQPDGPLCICGKHGCLEMICSGRALIKMVKDAVKNGEMTHLKKMMSLNDDALSIETIIKVAKLGDQFSIDCLAKISEELGKGITILLHLFNPEMIVLGGKLSRAGKYLLVPLEQTINSYAMNQVSTDVEIVLSDLGQNAGMLGMASVIFEKTFK